MAKHTCLLNTRMRNFRIAWEARIARHVPRLQDEGVDMFRTLGRGLQDPWGQSFFDCDSCRGYFIPAKATLVIVPSNLLDQWAQEISKFVWDGSRLVALNSGWKPGTHNGRRGFGDHVSGCKNLFTLALVKVKYNHVCASCMLCSN